MQQGRRGPRASVGEGESGPAVTGQRQGSRNCLDWSEDAPRVVRARPQVPNGRRSSWASIEGCVEFVHAEQMS
jgi:hypothetical protein